MFHAKSQYHLTLPQRNRIHYRSLDLFHHHGITVLYQTDLGCCLNRDHTCQLQIMDLLFKPVTQPCQIFDCLCIFRLSACLCFCHQLCQFGRFYFFQFLLSCQNIHGKLFKIQQILLIHPIQHRHIFHQLCLMIFQGCTDFFHICLYFVILCLHTGDFVHRLLQKREKSFFFFLRIKALQFSHHIRQHISHRSKIFGFYIFQCFLRKIGHFFLGSRTVLQNAVGVMKVDLFCKTLHHLTFFII